jgi:hypothetical protein
LRRADYSDIRGQAEAAGRNGSIARLQINPNRVVVEVSQYDIQLAISVEVCSGNPHELIFTSIWKTLTSGWRELAGTVSGKNRV